MKKSKVVIVGNKIQQTTVEVLEDGIRTEISNNGVGTTITTKAEGIKIEMWNNDDKAEVVTLNVNKITSGTLNANKINVINHEERIDSDC